MTEWLPDIGAHEDLSNTLFHSVSPDADSGYTAVEDDCVNGRRYV